MSKLTLSLIIGLVAGIIDIIPMIIQKLDKHATLSAFVQYVVVSVVIFHIHLPYVEWWMEGGIVSFMLALPILLLVSAKDKKAAGIIAVMSVIMGTFIAVAGHFLIP